jgi:predicted phage terminase large subunit-like protein
MATEAQRKHLERIATPLRLAHFMAPRIMGRPYNPYPWLQYLERETLATLATPGRIVQIVSVPPQSGKTTYFGFWLPFWYIGLNPDDLEMFIAYSSDYAEGWGRRVRDAVQMYGEELFGVGLNKSEQSVGNWRTTRGFGGMLSAGIDGGITGNPGHLIVVDDVIKNMQEALSAATKRSHINEWDGSIAARFQENTKVFMTATRWAEDDLSGTVVERAEKPDYEGIKVKEIRIKAVAEPDEEEELAMTPEQLKEWRDCLGRRKGEYLQGQHSPGFFKEKKASISPYVWSTLYQASPTARRGSMFPMDRWEWYDPADRPNMVSQVRIWDIAATEDGGDFTVGGLVGKDADGIWYVLDVVRQQLATADVKKLVKAKAVTDGRHIPIRMEQEKAGAGKAQIGTYKIDLAGWNFDKCKGEGAKLDRFGPYSVEQQDRRVRLPRYADGTSPEWVEAFIAEHRQQMPDGRGPKHDDQIDTIAYAVLELYDIGPVEASDPNNEFRPSVDQELQDRADDMHMEMHGDLPDHLARLLGRHEGQVDSLV